MVKDVNLVKAGIDLTDESITNGIKNKKQVVKKGGTIVNNVVIVNNYEKALEVLVSKKSEETKMENLLNLIKEQHDLIKDLSNKVSQIKRLSSGLKLFEENSYSKVINIQIELCIFESFEDCNLEISPNNNNYFEFILIVNKNAEDFSDCLKKFLELVAS